MIKKEEVSLILEESGYCLFRDDYITFLYQKQGFPLLFEASNFFGYFNLYRLVPVITPNFIVDNKQEPTKTFQIRQIHPILTSEYVSDNDLQKYVFKAFLSLFEDMFIHSKFDANEYIHISINPLPENYQSGNEYEKLFIPFIVNFQSSFDANNKTIRFLINSSESLIYLYTIDSILDDMDSRVLIGTYSIPLP